jgi:hypothetical protein
MESRIGWSGKRCRGGAERAKREHNRLGEKVEKRFHFFHNKKWHEAA